MKIHKGYLFDYFATGESWHLYVWKGKKKDESHDWSEKHVTIDPSDSFEIIEPKTKNVYVMHYWLDFKSIKPLLKEKLTKAIKENWKCNLIKWGNK